MGIIDFLKHLTNPESIVLYGGLALLLFIVFAETGLLIGFFLPGDSLIFISGMICVTKPYLLNVNLFELIIGLSASAILGNVIGYWFGAKVGEPLFKRDDSFIFKKKYLEMTQVFYNKNGGATLIVGRFLPIIRTFAPILAGIIKIDFRLFMLYNIIGAVSWIGSLASIGYYLGTYQWIQNNVSSIVLSLVIITMLPIGLGLRKRKSNRISKNQ